MEQLDEGRQSGTTVQSIGVPIEFERKIVVATVPSGEVRIEDGSDGAWILFDCDCTDALPYCRSQCCSLKGTSVFDEDYDRIAKAISEDFADRLFEFDQVLDVMVMKRDADGRCIALNRSTKLCNIYENRPQTCRDFHCTRGASQRGWKLPNAVYRQCNL